jgi:hypothetical protein
MQNPNQYTKKWGRPNHKSGLNAPNFLIVVISRHAASFSKNVQVHCFYSRKQEALSQKTDSNAAKLFTTAHIYLA